jgi:hypothetical protein
MNLRTGRPSEWQPVEDAEPFFLYIEANRMRLAQRLLSPYVQDYVQRATQRTGGGAPVDHSPPDTTLEAIVEHSLSRFNHSALPYAVFADPEGQREGVLWFLQSKVSGNRSAPGGRRLFCLYQPLRGKIEAVNPAVLWDLQPLKAADLYNDFSNRVLLNLLEDRAFVETQFHSTVLPPSVAEAAPVPHLLGAALVLWSRPDLPQVTVVQGDKGVGIFDVRPTWDAWEWMDPERKRAVDRAGLQAALAYERNQGRQPQDVSGKHHGFDLRSLPPEDGQPVAARYIAVKARARSGAIRLTANEWKMARHYGEQYWLYIVTQAANNPQLQRIQDPAAALALGGDVFATGFVVEEEVWMAMGRRFS